MPTKTTKKARPPARDNAVTILTSGCHFNGKLYCRGSSRIGGRIEGQIVSEGLLIIEEEALILAEVQADEAIIQGRVQGKLKAQGRIELTATSRFQGDIESPCLVINEGAQFDGRSIMPGAQDILAEEESRDPTIDNKNSGLKGKAPDVAVLKVPDVNVPTN